ncbi:HIT domain-containing protein [Pacificimonas flava]|uniref:Bis(5'-nucleosyl)-tetraphosphatase n=1 Tax=Pacificimonas flava TaxID=1234595 RepID=M2U1L2_9SPHN|nr:HIT domain-containing protein [Pacificimonas flava]EMD81857.1 Bis(5'-nucleosyl)-tetraphosphatase [Pacificimonas flava]MBB5281613.1 diadenosine tetraphosphate (Ap4A) HIT family hydrolase [Pacificimonas flava]
MEPVDAKGPYDDENVFAKILRGEIPSTEVYSDEHAYAFVDINPQAPTHVLVIPRGRYRSWVDFTESAEDAEIAGFIRAVGKVAKSLDVEDPGYRLLVNSGRHAHQMVPHLHVHLFAGRPLGPMLSGGAVG